MKNSARIFGLANAKLRRYVDAFLLPGIKGVQSVADSEPRVYGFGTVY